MFQRFQHREILRVGNRAGFHFFAESVYRRAGDLAALRLYVSEGLLHLIAPIGRIGDVEPKLFHLAAQRCETVFEQSEVFFVAEQPHTVLPLEVGVELRLAFFHGSDGLSLHLFLFFHALYKGGNLFARLTRRVGANVEFEVGYRFPVRRERF